MKHGGGSVMVWGCFGGQRVGDLIEVKGIMKKEHYHRILQKNAIPSGKRLIGRGFVLQQDNDPKHKSKLCSDYLKKKEDKGELVNMIWPPQSPDLSPIEPLWDELDRRVRQKRPTNVRQLLQALFQCWQEIPAETLKNLLKRMPHICQEVIKAKGGYFEESKKLGGKGRQ